MERIVKTPPWCAVAVVLGAAVFLAACGEKSSKSDAKKAAMALSDYYYAQWRAPSPDWQVQKVAIAKGNVVTVDTRISSKGLSKAIMQRSKMEQMEIARLACPHINEKIWSKVGKEQPVNIRLSGSAGHIMIVPAEKPPNAIRVGSTLKSAALSRSQFTAFVAS